jgi:hypothetical protein
MLDGNGVAHWAEANTVKRGVASRTTTLANEVADEFE